MNDFFIIGNGGSGTSLLRGLLDSHSRVNCYFELWGTDAVKSQIEYWTAEAKAEPLCWGDKIPLEQFWSRKWHHANIKSLIDHFHIVWIVRRFGKWIKKQDIGRATQNWKRSRKIYWAMRNHRPDKIIEVSFEDLLLRPTAEIKRICAFLKITYQYQMLDKGVKNTGHQSFDYGKILIDKI